MKSRVLFFVTTLLFIAFFMQSCEKDPEPDPDRLALSITNVTPANNAIGVPINATVKIDFSRAVDPKSASEISILKGQSVVASSVVITGSSAVITPNTPLENNVLYTVVAKGVKAADGGVAADFTSAFTTAKAPLLVESVLPADKGIGVKANAKVVIKFNKKLSVASQTGTGISIVDKDNKAIAFTASYDDTNTITLTPKEALYSSETYKVVVKDATADDGAVSSDFTSSFTVEKIPFTIVSIQPTDGATGVLVNSKIVIVFSKKLNVAAANGMEFIVAGMNASTPFNTTYDGKMTITITPETPMQKSTLYFVYISEFNAVQSMDGDSLEKVHINFTTEK